MIFSKRHFAVACLLLGTSGLLISCNQIKPSDEVVAGLSPNSERICADTAGMIAIEVPSKICKDEDTEPKPPKEHEEKSPDCIHSDLQNT